ncbi:hypothetical protein [Lignipirellula cremea]|uniref:Uncharacterized protein n=1 Tax=Lignipirellula cremea TaxID=2528010 RepID=A0A518E1S6_9BACT|nr:hypothetical protein [Lignipirellula cremea]QDU98022.1 hypothetical protein Pla8534_58830 [Lignipirellula cremea]
MTTSPRRGLAPLELVIWLPVLLFVAALMVNFNTMARLRLRGEIVARDEVHRSRWPRTGNTEPVAPGHIWPAPATASVEATDAWVTVDLPQLQHPVVRGPLPGFGIKPVLDPTQGGGRGKASIVRRYPMMPRLGSFESGSIEHEVLGVTFRNAEMNMPTMTRRTTILYEFPQTSQDLPAAFSEAVNAIMAVPHFRHLQVLDNDEDVQRYVGSHDFHPRTLQPYMAMMGQVYLALCQLDREEIYQQQVVPKIDGRNRRGDIELGEISRLPRTMTNFFLAMYNARIAELEALIDLLKMQPPTPTISAQIAAAEAEIAELKAKVAPLEAYRSRLSEIESELRRLAVQYEADSGIPLPTK